LRKAVVGEEETEGLASGTGLTEVEGAGKARKMEGQDEEVAARGLIKEAQKGIVRVVDKEVVDAGWFPTIYSYAVICLRDMYPFLHKSVKE
jgi:hypothetical protein